MKKGHAYCYMLPSQDIVNVIKKEAEKTLKYKDLPI